jgi:Icc-related predicted phosphoesterase
MPRLVFLSDTHNQLSKVTVPPCDILCISGDMTMMGHVEEIQKFNSDIGKLKSNGSVNSVVCVAGNHDWLFETKNKKARELIPNVDHYLQDDAVCINGLNIYGSPWQPFFCNWAFNLPRGKALQEKWAAIPHGLDLLITHGPPYKILDYVPYRGGENVGCQDLLDTVLEKKPRVHVFGHVHCGYGEKDFNGTHFINASTCNEQYRPINPPIVFDF